MLQQSFVIAFIVLAVHAVFLPGMIFGKISGTISLWAATKNGFYEKIRKPLFECPVCQTPWWGTIAYWIVYGNSAKEWVVCCICATGINFVISIYLSRTD